MQADAAVVFYGKGRKSDDSAKTDESDGIQEMGTKGSIRAVYVCGDVIMTEVTVASDGFFYSESTYYGDISSQISQIGDYFRLKIIAED